MLIFDSLEEEVLLYIDEGIVEIVREVVPEEFFEKEGFDSREDVNAALLAIEGLEFCVIARLVSFLFHLEVSW